MLQPCRVETRADATVPDPVRSKRRTHDVLLLFAGLRRRMGNGGGTRGYGSVATTYVPTTRPSTTRKNRKENRRGRVETDTWDVFDARLSSERFFLCFRRARARRRRTVLTIVSLSLVRASTRAPPAVPTRLVVQQVLTVRRFFSFFFSTPTRHRARRLRVELVFSTRQSAFGSDDFSESGRVDIGTIGFSHDRRRSRIGIGDASSCGRPSRAPFFPELDRTIPSCPSRGPRNVWCLPSPFSWARCWVST